MYSILIKLISMLMTMMTLFNGFVFTAPDFIGDAYGVALNYDFANNEAGSAAGTVTITADKDGEYELLWGTADGKALSVNSNGVKAEYTEFTTVTVSGGKGEADIHPYTAIPEDAETVVIERNGVIIGSQEIPEEKKADFGELLYSFGALSDPHFCRYGYPVFDTTLMTFPNALSFLNAFDVDLVAMSGDLSSSGTEEAFKKVNGFASQFDFPVLTCTGNHDVHDDWSLDNWHKYINTGVYGEEKLAGVVEVADNELDFVYEHEGDVFIFLSQFAWDYRHEDSRILKDEQLDWLEEKLENYKNDRVYLFFHTFLNAPDGTPMGEGNLLTSKGVYYDLAFTSGTPDEVRFRSLVKEYKNVIFFNGHSHWKFELQSLNPNLNITDYNGEYCTMVHIPSVGSPRYVKDDSKDYSERFLRNSEGYLVNVYNDKIVLKGIEFIGYKILSYATYVVNT